MALRSIAPISADADASRASIPRVALSLFVLTKPRLALFSVLSGMAGFAVAERGPESVSPLLVLTGLALSAGGALSFNQWWERDTDRLMRRTSRRPLPQDDLPAGAALAWSLGLGAGGVGLFLSAGVVAAAAFSAATIVLYGLVYTPLKRRTRWATETGSLSGALPPLIGAAAGGDLGSGPAWTLTGILLLWQMPHFFAIGWMYREDYRRAGFPLLPAVDPTGGRAARWSFGYVVALLAVSLVPWMLGLAGPLYGIVALVAGLGMLAAAVRFLVPATRDAAARGLFLASILYLPVVMAGLVVDCWT